MVEIVAEIGLNANGEVEIAKKLIDIAVSAGISYVKFQKRTIDFLYTKEELARYRESPWGTTFGDYKRHVEFNRAQYIEIQDYCEQKKMQWFASIWDTESIRFMVYFRDVPFIKIPSALITNLEMLESCKQTNKPLILSTGMSTFEMVDKAVDVLGKNRIYCILHCTSTYPSKPEELNMLCIHALKERYPFTKIGFSNHYPGLMGMVMAYIYGAEMLEFHITGDRSSWGTDHAASISPKGIYELMERLALVDKMKGDGTKRIYESEIPIMRKLRR